MDDRKSIENSLKKLKLCGIDCQYNDDGFKIKDIAQDKRTSTFKIPKFVTRLSERCLGECWWIREVELPKDLEQVDESAFDDYLNLTGINFGKNIRVLGKSCFVYSGLKK